MSAGERERGYCAGCEGPIERAGEDLYRCACSPLPWADPPETFEEIVGLTGCSMCGAHLDDPCDCLDPQDERQYR